MIMTPSFAEALREQCRRTRVELIETLHSRQTGHPGGSLSCCEILNTLYAVELHVDPTDPNLPERDRFVLSKGHAAPMLYCVLAEYGFFPKEELATLRCLNTRLQGHPCSGKTPGVDATSGPLGAGLSVSLGMALGLRGTAPQARVYTVLGDGELQEGTVWEAAMCAAKYKADNLCAVLDWNGVQLDGRNEDVMPLGDVKGKFEAFGWYTCECDGHDVEALFWAFEEAKTVRGRPSIILAHTVKGKGVSFMEGRSEWHGKAIDDLSYERAMQELGVAE